VAPNGGKTGQDYVLMDAGNVYKMMYANGAHHATGYLSRAFVGTCDNGETVTLPGYWSKLPQIMASSTRTPHYNHLYPSQSQTVVCDAENIRWRPGYPNQVQFTARMYNEITSASVAGTGAVTGAVNRTPSAQDDFPQQIAICSSVTSNCKRVVLSYSHAAAYGWISTGSFYMRRSYKIARTVYCQIYHTGGWHTIAYDSYNAYTDDNNRIEKVADSGWVGTDISAYRVVMTAGTASQTSWIGSAKVQYLNFVSRQEYLSATTAAVSGKMKYFAVGE
jgi:hypothetical protein